VRARVLSGGSSRSNDTDSERPIVRSKPRTGYDCVCFRTLAENVAASLVKGDRAFVQGNPELEHWTDREGKERTSKRIVANYVGPDLRFATAGIHKAARRSPSKATARDEGGYPDANEPF
jgi:single-strand DNA-binding protein